MDFNIDQLGDEAVVRRLISKYKRVVSGLEVVLEALGTESPSKNVRLIDHIEEWLKEHGPATRDEIVTAMLEGKKVRAQRDQEAQVGKSIDRGLQSGRLVEKQGKIGLPT